MTPVGHSLAATAIGFAASVLSRRPSPGLATLMLLVAVASLPDWPLPGWGHDAYAVSHSLPVNAALIVTLYTVLSPAARRWPTAARRWWRDWRTPLSIAWLSHLVLDGLYSHGRGVEIGWPIASYRLTIPVPWLTTLDLSAPILGPHNVRVFALEAATFGPIALLARLATRRNR